MNKIFIFFIYIFLINGCTKNIRKISLPEPQIRVKYNDKIYNLPIEEYVSYVLAGEVSKTWPLESLKAQAIAARTFALKKMKERQNQEFHISNSVMDQVFHHKTEKEFIQAAKETKGIIVLLENQIAETSFHSSCGGHTASAKSVWGTNHQHLEGVQCPFCKNSPSFSWQAKIPLDKLNNILGFKVKSIILKNRRKDGRIEKLMFNNNQKQTISAHQFRMKLGHMQIKSTNIQKAEILKDYVLFSGYGFGHGVGMCQYGALNMAKNGYLALEIIKYYYPGTKLKRAY